MRAHNSSIRGSLDEGIASALTPIVSGCYGAFDPSNPVGDANVGNLFQPSEKAHRTNVS